VEIQTAVKVSVADECVLHACRISQVEDIDQIGTSFAVETNRRDEDADM